MWSGELRRQPPHDARVGRRRRPRTYVGGSARSVPPGRIQKLQREAGGRRSRLRVAANVGVGVRCPIRD